MGPTEIELNPEYVRDMLLVLREFGVLKFKCPQFSVMLQGPEDEAEKPSTDVRGFTAPSADDEDDEDDEEPAQEAHFMRALGLRGHLPSLAPIVEPPDDHKD